MQKISSSQKKIIFIASVILLMFLIFWLFVYLPSKNEVGRIKSELQSVQGQLHEIETIVGRTKSIDESIELLTERHRQLKNKFPQKEEESLKMLSHLTRKLNIELVSIKPQAKVVFLDQDKKKVEIDGRTCQRVFVSMEMKCYYKDLVKYIETLKKTLPAFVTIESLRINRGSSETAKLNITLGINLYLLS